MGYRLFLTFFVLTIALLPLLALAEEDDDLALRNVAIMTTTVVTVRATTTIIAETIGGHTGDDWNNHGHNWGHGGDWNHHGGGWNNHGHGWGNGHGKVWNADNKDVKENVQEGETVKAT